VWCILAHSILVLANDPLILFCDENVDTFLLAILRADVVVCSSAFLLETIETWRKLPRDNFHGNSFEETLFPDFGRVWNTFSGNFVGFDTFLVSW
jgi:hypothetical protein